VFDKRLKSLPVPTLEQTARFADHVADNHSWYKHLPFFPPGASFVVFPNPHAGRGVRADGERFVVYDVARGEYFAHRSRLSTAEYLAQFGHWDYWVDDNPRVSDPQPGPWQYDLDGGWGLLADDLKRQWCCRLTAFLKPAPRMFTLRAGELQREADEFLASVPSRFGRILQLVLGGRPEVSAKDPAAERYRRVAGELRQATGSWGTSALSQFLKSEAVAQREVLLDALHRVRAAWSEGSGGPAERGAPHDPART
jgi:hypothetical protein